MIMTGLYILTLIYVYGCRIYIAFTLHQNITSMVPNVKKEDTYWSFGNRTVFNIFLNSFLFVLMIFLLALQVYHENLSENKPIDVQQKENETGEEQIVMSQITIYMIITTLIVPTLSLVVFAFLNYYYLLEIMIKVNIHVLNSGRLRNKIKQHSPQTNDILRFAKMNIHATPGRLRDIKSLNLFQRVFYILQEWWIDLLVLIWVAMIATYCYFTYNHINTGSMSGLFLQIYLATFVLCASIFVLVHFHGIIIVLVVSITALPLCMSVILQIIIERCKLLSSRSKVMDLQPKRNSMVVERAKIDNDAIESA